MILWQIYSGARQQISSKLPKFYTRYYKKTFSLFVSGHSVYSFNSLLFADNSCYSYLLADINDDRHLTACVAWTLVCSSGHKQQSTANACTGTHTGKGKGRRGFVQCLVVNTPLRRSGMAHVLLHTPCTSANGMNHTCLCLPSQSWYSFTDPVVMQTMDINKAVSETPHCSVTW